MIDLAGHEDIGAACAAALGTALGDAARVHAGTIGPSIEDIAGAETMRAARATFSNHDDVEGWLAIIVRASFAEALERAASDEILLTACAPAFEAALAAVAAAASVEVEVEVELELATEIDVQTVSVDDTAVVFPLLDGDDTVGCLVVTLAQVAASDPQVAVPTSATMATAASGTPSVLADVEVGITAELGRTSMTVRELLQLTPGAVIDLDRAAGAPIDVLVNGTLIARGEVVVIDEEFGIRISELLQPTG